MKTTKSPRRVLIVAHLTGRLSLPDYSHRFSPKKFTQPQLFACLVLKEFLQLDYRKLAALLRDASDLAAVIAQVVQFYKALPGKAVIGHRELVLRLLDPAVSSDDLVAFLESLTGPLPEDVWLHAP